MNIYERIYRSVVYFTAQLVPSGVVVVEGASYGVRTEDPATAPTSIAVMLGESQGAAFELGSPGLAFSVVFTINAQSRMQRDALKYILASGFQNNQIAVYTDFDQFVPASGATIERYAELGDYFKMRDMPEFDSDRERFFWISIVFVALNVIGL